MGGGVGAGEKTQLDDLLRELESQQRLTAIVSNSVSRFVAELAHDLKNPLAAIRINVQGLKRGLERGDAPPAEHLLERLTRIELSVTQALDQLAAARARIDADSAPAKSIRRSPTDLVGLVRDVVERLRALAGQERLCLTSLCDELTGMWDAEQLRQALEALLDNALKFSGPSGAATVTIRRSGPAAEVSIADSGIGIPAVDLAHVCERFYRAENVMGHYKGAGIGLFEAKKAISSHDGELLIESVERQGSTVTVRLPLT